ncbi:MAG: hypothetical protein IIA88_01345 [Bacteroidetes bacterium]|nr:hypothetical protein [Bacteroidota bacterium]
MITLNKKAYINDDHILTLNLPKSIPTGEYEILVVLGENQKPKNKRKQKQKKTLWFPKSNAKIDPNETFRRVDMYGNDGR